jgi:Amt family ammonium transporter
MPAWCVRAMCYRCWCSVGPAGALIIGLSAAIVCYFSTRFIKRTLSIVDSLAVFLVHGVDGILGTFLVAIFA